MTNRLETYVALLRGVNVGGNRSVSMADLKSCFRALGYGSVETYINSGNVIFRSAPADPRALEAEIETALVAQFSDELRVVVRSLGEMKKLIEQIPEVWDRATDEKQNIIFLRNAIDRPEILEGFHPKPGIEEVRYRPGVLFWSAKTSDLTKSEMLKVNRMTIYQDVTVRSVNTTRRIYDLMLKAEGT